MVTQQLLVLNCGGRQSTGDCLSTMSRVDLQSNHTGRYSASVSDLLDENSQQVMRR